MNIYKKADLNMDATKVEGGRRKSVNATKNPFKQISAVLHI